MKASDAARAAVLVQTLNGLDILTRTISKAPKDPSNERRALEIQVSDLYGSSGGSGVADIELDQVTGAKILPLVRKVIEDELTAIGVVLDQAVTGKHS